MLGGILAICSAACFAFNNASVRRAVLSGSVLQGMAITVPIGVPLFFIAATATGHLGAVLGFSPTALAALSAAGIMHFVWGRYCNYRATMAMGTNLVAPVQQFNLLVTLVLAVWLLGEHLTPLKILGIVLVLLGPTFTMSARLKSADDTSAVVDAVPVDTEKPVVFQPRYAEGYLFALLSAIGYGLSPILIRVGLENQGIGVSLAGGLVAYIAATIAFGLVILLWPGQVRHVLEVPREAAKWFTFSGFLVFFSQMFLYMALSVAPVTVVSPINRLSILFRLYFSRLLNPQHEVFGGSVIAATVVSLLGALLLSLSTDVLQAVLPLPPDVLTFLNWTWP